MSFNVLNFTPLLAQAEGTGNSPLFMPIWFVLMIGIFYVIAIRPQQRRERERQAMIASVKKGDQIVFSGGMLGTVVQTSERELTVKIAENTKIDILRAAVNNVITKGDQPTLDGTAQK